MQKTAINKDVLGEGWGISAKTLHRWRTGGHGPRYLKLSKRLAYQVDEVLNFENGSLAESTWERSSHVVASPDANLVTARGVATATSLPM